MGEPSGAHWGRGLRHAAAGPVGLSQELGIPAPWNLSRS